MRNKLVGKLMPVVSMKEILDHAFRERYGVGAFNIFNDLTLEGVCQSQHLNRAENDFYEVESRISAR